MISIDRSDIVSELRSTADAYSFECRVTRPCLCVLLLRSSVFVMS